MQAERTIGPIARDPSLHAPDPQTRLVAAMSASGRSRRRLERLRRNWPPNSPGAVNAWLLMVTTKPPTWRDPLITWPDDPAAIGAAHAGFFYPDPLGFWAEVRRWALTLVRRQWPEVAMAGALSVTALMHSTDVGAAKAALSPRVILFLDEAAWDSAGLTPVTVAPYRMPDPYRAGQEYEGLWGRLDDGTVVGKAPQHPAAHKLYRAADVDAFLAAAPL